ncbi:MAG TPA: site-specific integrase [Candidatus Hydrogenedentes bacterium]|nr:site-specific integrase [Candidatus Hydrogenedentota bacterium]
MPKSAPPALCLHRAKNLFYVRICGRAYYLGADPAQARRAYFELLAETHGGTTPPPTRASDVTVLEVFSHFVGWAEGYYATNPATWQAMKTGFAPFLEMYGEMPAASFGPKALKAYRAGLVDGTLRGDGARALARKTVNQRIREIVRVFKFAASEEMLPPSVAQALAMVEPLRMGRSAAREPRPVKPVAWGDVEATLPFLPRPVRGLVLLAWHTGARIGELTPMRPRDIDRSSAVWEYRPPSHKNAWRGQDRVILIGPQGQEVLRAALMRARGGDPVFSPRDVYAERSERATVHRRPDQKPNPRKTERTINAEYAPNDITRAIARAVEQANAERERSGLPTIPRWTIHQVRHSFATRCRAAFGSIELARAALGHAHTDATAIYAEQDMGQARTVAAKIG